MIVAALLLAAQATTAAPAAPVPAPTPAPTATAPTARLNLDTPVERIVADPKGKAVLDANLPELTPHPSYEMFKTMSLNQLQGYAPDKLTPAVLATLATALAAIK